MRCASISLLALVLGSVTAAQTAPLDPGKGVRIERYYPPTAPGNDAWARVDPSVLGWDTTAWAALDAFLAASGTDGFLVLQGGRILLERYYGGWGIHSTRPAFSVTKSITATQIGTLQAAGLLSIDDPVTQYVGSGWSNATPAQEMSISIRHLLTMTSGLDDTLFPISAPGATWYYSTEVYRELLDVIEGASGATRRQVARVLLLRPIGMHDTRYEPGGEFMLSSTRDLARFALLISREGVWESTTVLPDKAYLDEMLEPSQSLNLAYGLLWWLNGQASWTTPDGTMGTGTFIPSAPDDMVMALGALDQKVYIVPSMDLIVVRQGGSGGGAQGSYDEALWSLIKPAMP